MPIRTLQERLNSYEVPINDNLIIFSSDRQKYPMPDLATREGQRRVDDITAADVSLIIVDNLSCLASGRENDAESWNNIARWAIAKRSEGKSILFIHHSGKDGNQRGTSKREDILDTVIALRAQTEAAITSHSNQGARFEVHFEKSRHIYGDAIKPFTASLINRNNKQQWIIEDIKSSTSSISDKIKLLWNRKLSADAIAKELKINRSTVYRYINKG